MENKPETTKTIQDMNKPLYDLSHDFALIVDHLTECGGEMTEENLALWNNIQGAVSEKLESCAIMMQAMTAQQKAIKEEAKRLTDRAKIVGNRIEHLKRYTFEHMSRMDIKKNESAIASLRIQNNPPTCDVVDVADVPVDLLTVTVKMSGAEWARIIDNLLSSYWEDPGDDITVIKTVDKKAVIKRWKESHESEQTPGTKIGKSKSLRLY